MRSPSSADLDDIRYWNRGVANVPWMTGAATLMDGTDIREHAQRLGFALPFRSVLDVGCGTGRLSSFADAYVGVDISKDAVSYCQQRSLDARLVFSPEQLWTMFTPNAFEWVTCLSVFTHIHRTQRIAYLKAFAALASNLLVDIIPGDGSGDISLWTADYDQFVSDMKDTGWGWRTIYNRVGPSGPTHRYFWAERVVIF